MTPADQSPWSPARRAQGEVGAAVDVADNAEQFERLLAGIIDRFEAAWERDQRPCVADYLPLHPEPRSAVLRELVLVDFERRFSAGLPVDPEDYGREFPELDGDDSLTAEFRACQDGCRRTPGAKSSVVSQHSEETARPGAARDHVENMPAHDFHAERLDPAATGDLPAIPGYQVLREIGRGGMGIVYEAIDLSLARPVAVKVVDVDRSAGAELARRLRREAQVLASLRHPQIVQVFDVGQHDGRPFLVMELLEGGSLQTRLDRGPLASRDGAALCRQLAAALDRAHAQRIVHRDLKPANILFADDGTAKIADFGLARRLEQDSQLTRTGEIVGTPSYMAPEQAFGDSGTAGPATDVYALGALLYAMLTGKPPFQAPSVYETLEQVRHESPAPLRELAPGVPRDLETICLKCLEKDPRRRYASMQLAGDEIERFLAGRPILARPVGRMERLARWARRQPVVASLTAAVGLLLLSVAAVATVSAVSVNAARRIAEQKARDERAARGVLDQHRYAARMRLAQAAYESDDWGAAQRDLEAARPLPGDPDPRGFEWDYLSRLALAQSVPLKSDAGPLFCVRYTPDGRNLVAGSERGVLFVLESVTNRLVRRIEAHQKCINDIEFSPISNLAATASCDHTVILWDTHSWQPISRLAGHTLQVNRCAFSPDGSRLATATTTDPGDGSPARTPEIRVWDVASRHLIADDLVESNSYVVSLKFLDQGTMLLASCGNGEYRRWDVTRNSLESSKIPLPLNSPPRKWESGLVASADGRRLVYCADDTKSHVATLVDLVSNQCRPLCTQGWSTKACEFSNDGELVAVATDKNAIQIVRASTAAPMARLYTGTDRTWASAFSPDGRSLATVNYDGSLMTHDVSRMAPTVRRFEASNAVFAVDVDCRYALYSDPKSKLQKLDLQSGQSVAMREDLSGDLIDQVVLSNDGQWVLLLIRLF